MGKIKQGVLGGFSGKVGAVVGSRWKSVYYMRGLTDHVNDKNSLKQQAQRAKFAVAQAFAHDVLGFARLGYAPELRNRTAYNGLVSYLLRYAMTGNGTDWELDFDKVMVSRGSLNHLMLLWYLYITRMMVRLIMTQMRVSEAMASVYSPFLLDGVLPTLLSIWVSEIRKRGIVLTVLAC